MSPRHDELNLLNEPQTVEVINYSVIYTMSPLEPGKRPASDQWDNFTRLLMDHCGNLNLVSHAICSLAKNSKQSAHD